VGQRTCKKKNSEINHLAPDVEVAPENILFKNKNLREAMKVIIEV
jgi:hypothetical protein